MATSQNSQTVYWTIVTSVACRDLAMPVANSLIWKHAWWSTPLFESMTVGQLIYLKGCLRANSLIWNMTVGQLLHLRSMTVGQLLDLKHDCWPTPGFEIWMWANPLIWNMAVDQLLDLVALISPFPRWMRVNATPCHPHHICMPPSPHLHATIYEMWSRHLTIQSFVFHWSYFCPRLRSPLLMYPS